MSGARPLVSIGVPVYNGERYLRDALDSLLGQTYENLEVVICDNASTDSTEAICREYAARDSRIRYIRSEKNIGCLPNFRRVRAECTGELFSWTCADDMRPPSAVEDAVEALRRNPAAVFVHGPIQVENTLDGWQLEVGNEMDLSGPRAADRIHAFTRGITHNAMLFGLYRRDVANRLVFGTHSGQDYLFCLQACLMGRAAYSSSPIIHYRQKGPVGSPMHDLEPITLRDLLIHWGVRRTKCWITLLLGCYYLGGARGPDLAERLGGMAAHVGSFVRRYHRQLVGEIPFILCMPLLWLLTPIVPTGRRLRARLRARRAHGV